MSDHFYRDLAVSFRCALQMLAEEYVGEDDAPELCKRFFNEASTFLGSNESVEYRIITGLQLDSLHKEH